MQKTGHGVDHRDSRRVRETHDVLVRPRADDHGIDHLRHHPRGVLDRLASTKLGIRRVQHDGVAAELPDTGFETHAGAGALQLKDHDQAFPGQQRAKVAGPMQRLHLDRARNDASQLVGGAVVQGQKIAFRPHRPGGDGVHG